MRAICKSPRIPQWKSSRNSLGIICQVVVPASFVRSSLCGACNKRSFLPSFKRQNALRQPNCFMCVTEAMGYFEPSDRKEWFEALAHSTRTRALGCADEGVRITLLEVAETYLKLAAMRADYCFCGREATSYKSSRGERLGLCHLHAVAWESSAEQVRKEKETQSLTPRTKACGKRDKGAAKQSFAAPTFR